MSDLLAVLVLLAIPGSILLNGGDELAWSNTIPLGDAGTTTPATVPGRAPVPTGTGPGGQYDPGGPGGFSTGGY